MKRDEQKASGAQRGSPAGTGDANISVPALFAMALRHHQHGQMPQAEELYRQILSVEPRHVGSVHHLGIAALQAGRFADAIELIGKAIALDDRNPQSHYQLGLAFGAVGRFKEAAAQNQLAIALKSDYAEAHMNLGNALKALGRIEMAIDCYRRTLALRPNLPDAHYNLANVLAESGKSEEAIQSYRQALALRPNYAEAHNNLGTVLMAQGSPEQAAAYFQSALAINPGLVEAYCSLAVAYMSADRLLEAVNVLCRALTTAPADRTRELFAYFVASLRDVPQIEGFRPFLMQALAEPWTRPARLARIGAQLLKASPPIERLARAVSDPPADDCLQPSEIAGLGRDPLVRCVLESGPVCDSELEATLTALRRQLLHMALDDDFVRVSGPEFLDLACTLARQCFINEYVFACTDAEIELVRVLRERLVAALDLQQTDFPAFSIALFACYQSLHTLEGADGFLAWPLLQPLSELLTQQVREPLEEASLRSGIPRLTAITDDVSVQVQQQYEENPYPRWVQAAPAGTPSTIAAYLRRQIPFARPREPAKLDGIDILVAGCGTGQQPIEIARQISGARVLAIDLSLSSLGYAKRKSSALRLANIDYAQADILETAAISQTFDVIEAVGVLHHLADPVAGWKALQARLRPGGFMHLAFYSELARTDIAAAQAFIAARGYASAPEEIRRFRQDLRAIDSGALARKLAEFNDWYSTSECRDLLFHVQEHRLTMPQIKALLAEMKLVFLGFEVDARVQRLYAQRFPADRAMTDLDCWHVFEGENPRTFLGMYQFWVQKRA